MSDQNLDIVINLITKGDASGALKELQKIKAASSGMGGESGEHAADNFSEKFEHKLKHHMANIAGKFAGIPGVGGLVSGFGIAGAAASIGFGLLERSIDAVVEHYKKLKEETAELVKLHQELREAGADEKLIVPMAEHVKLLAQRMGGDLKAATTAATDGLRGNFDALRKLGIVIDDDLPLVKQLEQAMSRLRMEGRDSLYEIENAAHLAAAAVADIKKQSDDATAALQKNLAQIQRNKAAFDRATGNKEGADIADIEASVLEGKTSRGDADQQINALKTRNATARFNAEYATKQTEIGKYKGAIDAEQGGMGAGAEDLQERERIVETLNELRRVESLASTVQKKIDARVEASFGKGKTEDEYRKFLSTINPELAAGALGPLDELAKERAGHENTTAGLRSQLPVGRNNLSAETEALNKLRPEIVKAQNEAYGRINAHMEKIAELEADIAEAQKAHEEELRKLAAEGRGKSAENKGRLSKLAGSYLAAAGKDFTGTNSTALPPELKGRRFHRDANGEIIFDDEASTAAPRPQWQGAPRQPPTRRDQLNAEADRYHQQFLDALETGNQQGAESWDRMIKAKEKELDLLEGCTAALESHDRAIADMQIRINDLKV